MSGMGQIRISSYDMYQSKNVHRLVVMDESTRLRTETEGKLGSKAQASRPIRPSSGHLMARLMMMMTPGNENLSSSSSSSSPSAGSGDTPVVEQNYGGTKDHDLSFIDGYGQPLQLFTFILFLVVLPLLSIQNFKQVNQNKRRRKKLSIYNADYEPHWSIVEAVQKPLKTRKHFRISHVGNYRVGVDGQEGDLSEEDIESTSDSSSSSSKTETTRMIEGIEYRLVFGKRERGEEGEFLGRSALKGSRASQASSTSNDNLSTSSNIKNDKLSIRF
ncbi:hypothetical protein BY996DRAFT_8262788, partial [Phakopsora pachyrhizi]